MKRKKNALIVSIVSFLFVVLLSNTLMTSRATFYKTGSRTKLFSGVITQRPNFLMPFIVNDAPRSGTDIIMNNPWILTEDHTGEYRYAGSNPDNFLSFNGELWRIIGVMPNMTYCTGTYGSSAECNTKETGSLVKITREEALTSFGSFTFDYKQSGVGSSISNSGSNDWTDSQLMLMLNGENYLTTGYDINNTRLHTSYTTTGNLIRDLNGYVFYDSRYSYLDGDGTTVIKPNSATTGSFMAVNVDIPKKINAASLAYIATVKWDLYGTNTAGVNPQSFYNKERNISNAGAVYNNTSLTENRAVYWYGKIGLLYPSDYGYSTNGYSTTTRATCLAKSMSAWDATCGWGSYLYRKISNVGSNVNQQNTMTPSSANAYSLFKISSAGGLETANSSFSSIVRPTLYLKIDTPIFGGNGTWSNPYTIEAKQYWFDYTACTEASPCSFPNYGDELVNNPETPAYVAQDSSKYYVCTTIPDGEDESHEVCLSQDYTQYGLYGVTLNESSTFSSSQQNSVKSALKQVFANSGTTIDIDEDCFSDQSQVFCQVSSGTATTIYRTLTVLSNGTVVAGYSHRPQYRSCMINRNGQVSCSISAP